jgi:hypothetical protein
MKFRITYFLLSAVIIIAISSPGLADEKSRPKVEVIDRVHEFGFIPIGYEVVHYYKFYNSGSADLKVIKAIPNCDCSQAFPLDTLIAPGDTSAIRVHFNTEQYYGATRRNVNLVTNDPDNPSVILEYTSNIGFMPRLFKVSPISLFFLKGNMGREVELINNSNVEVAYTIETEEDSLFTLNSLKGSIKPESTIKLSVTPVLQLPKGTHHSNFAVVFYTEGMKARITVPIKIAHF